MPASTWSRPGDVTARAERLWATGAVLRELHTAESERSSFPARIRLIGPTKAELGEDLPSVIAWARTLRQDAEARSWRLDSRRMTDRVLGAQTVPVAAIIDTPHEALALLGRSHHRSAALFSSLLEQARSSSLTEAAVTVALKRPLMVLDVAGDWPVLLQVAEWVIEHPHSGVQPRQVPVPGMHTKIIEQHGQLLRLLIDTAAPQLADSSTTAFAARYGLAEPSRQIRLRANGALVGLPHLDDADVAWPVAGLAASEHLQTYVNQIVIVENALSYQAVPLTAGRLVLWGGGKEAADLLGRVPWLTTVGSFYWGDIDSHGFQILATVRQVLPQVRSILMDVDTLLEHRPWWVAEPAPTDTTLPSLTDAETQCFELLRNESWGMRVRLEQEFIGVARVEQALTSAPEPNNSADGTRLTT